MDSPVQQKFCKHVFQTNVAISVHPSYETCRQRGWDVKCDEAIVPLHLLKGISDEQQSLVCNVNVNIAVRIGEGVMAKPKGCACSSRKILWKWRVMWNSNSQRNSPFLALCHSQGPQVNAQNIVVLVGKTFVPGHWYMNSHNLTRKERLETTEFLS